MFLALHTSLSLALSSRGSPCLHPTHYSSIIEVGISIFAAALTALRPFLTQALCFRGISSGGSGEANGKTHALALAPLRTFGQGQFRVQG